MAKRGHNEGNIRHLKKRNMWEARYTVGFDKDGKQIQRSLYAKTREEVKDKLLDVLNKLRTGSYIEPSKAQLNELLDAWMEHTRKINRLKPTTLGTYEQHVRVHIKPAIGHIELKKISASKIQDFYHEKTANGKFDGTGGLSSATIIKIHNILNLCLKYAVKNKMIAENPMDNVVPPKLVEKQMRILTWDEQLTFQKLLDKERLKAAFMLDLASGLRLGELLALTWNDVNLDKGYLIVNKTLVRIRLKDSPDGKKTKLITQSPKTKKSVRTIPILPEVIPMLEEHKNKQIQEKCKSDGIYSDNNLVFCTELGNYIEPRNVMRTFYRLIKKANIPHTNFHALRHTCATRLLELDGRDKVIQEILGHSTPLQTMKYMHIMDDTMRTSISKLSTLFKTPVPTTE